MLEIDAIILTNILQKEKDAMVSALTKDGLLSFYARGVKDNKSKNAAAVNIGVLAKLELNEGRQGGLHLKSGTLIKNLSARLNNLLDYASFNYAIELAMKGSEAIEDKEKAYEDLLSLLEADDKASFIVHLLIYIAHNINLLGAKMKVDGCIKCGDKHHIVTYSLDDGGLICDKHFDNFLFKKYEKDEINLFRFVFMAKQDDTYRVDLDLSYYLNLLDQFTRFLNDSVGINIKSFSLFKPFYKN